MILNIIGNDVVPYFKIDRISKLTSKTLATEQDLNSIVKSFTVTEKEKEFLTCDLEMIDSTGLLNKIMRYGSQVNIEWGLKETPIFIQSFGDEATGNFSRRAICSVVNNSYSMSEGIGILTVSLRLAKVNAGEEKNRTFTTGTLRGILNKIALELQADLFLDSDYADIPILPQTQIIQSNITNLSFLRFLAWKYNAKLVFQTLNDPLSFRTMKIFFVEWSRQTIPPYTISRGLTGKYHYFDYGTYESNIISGNFNSNGNSQNGTSTTTKTTPDGKIQISVQGSKPEITETWELNPAAIRDELKKRGLKDQSALVSEILSASEDEFLSKLRKKYFVKSKTSSTTSSSDGNGYTSSVSLVFNPDYQIGDLVFVGSEKSIIPPQFKTRKIGLSADTKTLWRISALTTKINDSGASMDAELAR